MFLVLIPKGLFDIKDLQVEFVRFIQFMITPIQKIFIWHALFILMKNEKFGFKPKSLSKRIVEINVR